MLHFTPQGLSCVVKGFHEALSMLSSFSLDDLILVVVKSNNALAGKAFEVGDNELFMRLYPIYDIENLSSEVLRHMDSIKLKLHG